MKHPVKAEWNSAAWEGGRTVALRVKIVEGPQGFLDRDVTIRLSFQQIEHLAGVAQAAAEKLNRTEAQIAAVNASNAE